MGIHRAPHGHDALQPFGRDIGEHAGGDLLTDQYRLLREVAFARADVLQVGKHPQPQVFDIRRPLLEVGVFHLLEAAHVLADHVLQCALGPFAPPDAVLHIAGQRLVVEHVQVGIEKRQFLPGQALGELFADTADVAAHRAHRPFEKHQFHGDVGGFPVRHVVEAGDRLHDRGRAQRNARRAGQAADPEIPDRVVGIEQRIDAPGHFGVSDGGGKLRRQGDQERLFIRIEAPRLALLGDQHAEGAPVMDDRHAEKGVERFFPQFRHRVKAGMLARRREVDRFSPFANQADQSLPHVDGRLADRIRIQPCIGGEQVLPSVRRLQVDRAHFDGQRIANLADDDAQGFLQ